MGFWPFKKKQTTPEQLTPTEVRDRLITAAKAGVKKTLLELCRQYKDQVAANLDLMSKVPEGMGSNHVALDGYIQHLHVVAQCLATDCGAPELLNRLTGPAEENPLQKWDKWFTELPQRMERLEHDALVAEAAAFITTAQSLQGPAARQNETLLYGRLGELLFQSGRVNHSIEAFRTALELCRESKDPDGERAYLNNLLEAHRHLGDTEGAVRTGDELLAQSQKEGKESSGLKRRIERIKSGEPLCRIVCMKDDEELEIDDIQTIDGGRYEFQFRRNRLSLQMSSALIEQGNTLASSGKHAEALEKYQQASAVDPHDPDPHYQSGNCLLEMGVFGKARETFDEVERLAPGWFRCRSDRWLAEALESGKVTFDEFKILRVLEDGGLPMQKALPITHQAIQKFPDFAPFYLILGDLLREHDGLDLSLAIECYRKGLDVAVEPDVESRLISQLVSLLPNGTPEKLQGIQRARTLKGSLVAQATVTLIGLQGTDEDR